MKILATATLALVIIIPSHADPPRRSALSERLSHAIRQNDLGKALQHLKRGADVNTRDEAGRTILMLAAAKGDVGALKKIKSRKAELDLQDNLGRTALMHASPDIRTLTFFLEAGANTALKDKRGNDFTHYFEKAFAESRETYRRIREEELRRPRIFQGDFPLRLPVPPEVQATLPQ